jgi:hypothetical protein
MRLFPSAIARNGARNEHCAFSAAFCFGTLHGSCRVVADGIGKGSATVTLVVDTQLDAKAAE